jgi:uncharacterized protein
MGDHGITQTLQGNDPVAVALVTAIRSGDMASLEQLLAAQPELATVRIEGRGGGWRTPLHVAADWPGYFPNGPAVVALLIAAGADPNAAPTGPGFAETPLHWAASSDDVDVAVALIDGGADLEAPGASIAGGTPLDDAVGYGCWRVARLLVSRGAKVEKLWHAAALGLMSRVEEHFAAATPPTPDEVNQAFWQACNGGQRRVAEYLHAHGADLNYIPDYAKQPPLDVAASLDTGRQALISWLRDQGTKSETQGAPSA